MLRLKTQLNQRCPLTRTGRILVRRTTPVTSTLGLGSQLQRAYPGLCSLAGTRLLRSEPQPRKRGPAMRQRCTLAAGKRAAQVQQVHQHRAVAHLCDG